MVVINVLKAKFAAVRIKDAVQLAIRNVVTKSYVKKAEVIALMRGKYVVRKDVVIRRTKVVAFLVKRAVIIARKESSVVGN